MTSTERAPMIATYRIQLTPEFGFTDTIGLFDHLTTLGVSHVYLSPVAEAVPGSTHGYDVVDHTTVRAEFGGEAGLVGLLDAAAEHGLGVIIDHVPNHMSAARAELNDRWWEMLRDGPESAAARWFDVDWEFGSGKVLVPKLGEPLAEVLAAGGLSIERGAGGPELRYGPLRFPLAPGTDDLDVAEAVRRQHYELMWWRDPRRNVRRFFTIDDLVAIRVEHPDVAAVVDSIPDRLTAHAAFAGVRVDHVDGLADPQAYLEGLRERIGSDRWLLVEKILAPDEMLPRDWPVDGTTGYEHIRVAEHAALDPSSEQPLTDLWNEWTADTRPFEAYEEQARREVLDGGLAPDLDRLVRLVTARHGLDDARDASIELTVGLHRYRTYLRGGDAPGDSVDQLRVARDRAVDARPDLTGAVDALVAAIIEDPDVATRWQQLTSPVMAKGAEDRAFFRYLRLASLCEVGGSPGAFALPIEDFHRHQLDVQELMPRTMLAGTTHDTKRSEGVRARSLALAELADDWVGIARRWAEAHAETIAGIDRATVLLALQTVVTAWPIDRQRLTEYLVKSTREADEHTSWTEPDDDYEAALERLASTLEADLDADTELAAITRRLLRPGWSNSLATAALRLTSPGVPDLYQGTAAFTYSLVDPDNRVEPDWDERRALVDTARAVDGPTAWAGEHHDAAKAVVIERILRLRRRRAAAFGDAATYAPLEFVGRHADRLLGFVRGTAEGPLVATIVVTRSIGVDDWVDTAVTLPEGAWRSVLEDDAQVVAGGVDVPVTWWLDRFPVAVLDRADP